MDRFYRVSRYIRALWQIVAEKTTVAWVGLQVWLSFALSAASERLGGLVPDVIRSAWQVLRRKVWVQKRTEQAEKRLRKQMDGPSSAGNDTPASDRLDTAAAQAAQQAPLTVAAPPSPEGDEESFELDEHMLPQVETVPDPFDNDTPVGQQIGSSARSDVEDTIDDTYEFADSTVTETVTTTSREHDDAGMIQDAEIVPPPYRSDIKTEDLTVRGMWEGNPNTAEQIQEATRFPLVDNQIRKTVKHLTTSKPTITGPEEQADVLREWFQVEMEIGSNHKRGLNRFVEDLADQMLRYGSAALIKQRTRSKLLDSYKDPRTGGQRAPVWGYALPDMATMQVFIDRHGRPRKWRQAPEYYTGHHDVKEYQARDVFMTRLPMRQSAMYFWTPSLVMPVIYAIEVLRDLHDTIESHTKNIIDIPSYARVGDKNYIDGQATPSMIDRVAKSIRQASRGEMLIIPWYVEVEKIESEDYTEELLEVADFWERVVRRGVGGSKLDDGEPDTANRSTSDTLDEMGMRVAQALVPEIQRAFRWMAVDKLAEHGFTAEDFVSDGMAGLEFEQINLAQQMAREGHVAFLFQSDILKHSEARQELDIDPDPERKDTYFSDIQAKIKNTESAKNETESQVRPNGNPKPKRKQDQTDGRDLLPDDHPASSSQQRTQ